MSHKYKLTVILLTFICPRVSTLNYGDLNLERNLNQEKLINYLSTMLCSIDLKVATIYYEFEANGNLLDGLFNEISMCVPLSATIIAYRNGENISTHTNSGAHLVVLIVDGLKLRISFFPMLLQSKQKEHFNLFYVIISESQLSDDHEHLLNEMYWKYDVLNAIVVGMDTDDSDLSVITYNPFKNISIRIPNNAYKREKLFSEKNSNLFGGAINIVMYKDTVTSFSNRSGSRSLNFNYDEFLPYFISVAMNATPLLKTPFTKDFDVEDLRKADLTLNGRSYSTNVLEDIGIEETIVMRRDDICILVPYNRIQNTFYNLSRTVAPLVWMMMIVVLIHTWISLYAIGWVQQYQHRDQVFLFHLFSLHMNQSLTHIPKRDVPKFIIALWLMYCLIINSVFQGSLYTSMASGKDSRISTVDELLKSNGHELLVSDIFYNYSEYILNNSPIKNRFHVINFVEYLHRMQSEQIRYAFVARKRGLKYFENTEIVDGKPVYYLMEQCIAPRMTYYFVRRGCPFLNRINYLFRMAEEIGLLNYWEAQLINAYNKVKQNHRLFTDRKSEDLENIGFVFELWGYGLILSTGTFIIEWFVSRVNLNTNYSNIG